MSNEVNGIISVIGGLFVGAMFNSIGVVWWGGLIIFAILYNLFGES